MVKTNKAGSNKDLNVIPNFGQFRSISHRYRDSIFAQGAILNLFYITENDPVVECPKIWNINHNMITSRYPHVCHCKLAIHDWVCTTISHRMTLWLIVPKYGTLTTA